MDSFTVIACLVIIIAFICAWWYVAKIKEEEIKTKRKWMEQLPSVISTLGVLGTFLGITRGLVSFDTASLDTSIPVLLDGLKTAFFTSLLGMSGSLILNRIVSAKFDRDSKMSEQERTARMIIDALNGHHKEMPRIIADGNKDLVTVLTKNETVKIIRQDVEQLKDDIEELKGLTQEFRTILQIVSDSNSALAEELPRLRAVAVTATASISAVDNNMDEVRSIVTSLNNNSLKVSGMIGELNVIEKRVTNISNDTEEIKSSVEDISTSLNNSGRDF